MSKTLPSFEFIDEPQYRTTMSRAETANRLWSYRCKSNGNKKRYSVMLEKPGVYLVTLRYSGAPTALIDTKH